MGSNLVSDLKAVTRNEIQRKTHANYQENVGNWHEFEWIIYASRPV